MRPGPRAAAKPASVPRPVPRPAQPPPLPARARKPPFLGLTRAKRVRIYIGLGVAMLLGFLVWMWSYLQPSTWYKYTDHVAFEQVARDVQLGHVVWEPAGAELVPGEGEPPVRQVSVSSDNARMVYSTGRDGGDANLFLRRWDGTSWGEPRPLRALNSAFHESAPALSGDGRFLFFASDRPGGLGGDDIWVAKWDGVEYAWPLPLTGRVNSPFDEVDPELSPDGGRLYFASNRPYLSEVDAVKESAFTGKPLEDVRDLKRDFNLYAADLASDTPFDLLVERRLSMLYSLREGALADPEVMAKLGGSRETEAAVDRALEYLAQTQEEDGRWDIRKGGGQGGHDVAATAFALLAFYGRGERHDEDCQYRDTVRRGLDWLVAQQDVVTGDMRGEQIVQNEMYDQGIASLALIEAYGVTKDPTLKPRAIAALEFMTNTQHAAGGWRYGTGRYDEQKRRWSGEPGDLSVTGWFIMALASAEMSGIPVPEATFEGARKFLESVSGGEHGGSYGYTDSPGRRRSNRHGMDAAGFFCSQLLGASPSAPRAWESADILSQTGARGDLYYIYYGTVAAYQFQGALWREWREQMQQGFLRSQHRDGWWNGSGSHSGAMGRIVATAITALCLEAHYRYTPLYGLGYEPDPAGPVAGALDQSQLPETPLFRHAKYLEEFNSPADDLAPAVTEHGDFLYCASSREGGFGGMDIWRARISGAQPGALQNLGEEVNSDGDETDPELRMEGFHLLFNSDREGAAGGGALLSAKSRRLVLRHSILRLPDFGWILRNALWLAVLAGALGFGAWSARRAWRERRRSHRDRPPTLGPEVPT